MIEQFEISREAFARTIRLVTTARMREAVLKGLVDTDQEADELAEIEGATSQRLVAQGRGVAGIPANSLIHGKPNQGFINAAFAYAPPRNANRFNGTDRGAWYAALEVETAIAEVGYHLTGHLAALGDAGDFNTTVSYAELFADFIGEFVDLRGVEQADCLHPDPPIGYPAGNVLADEAMARDLNGIVYPSVRRAGGTNLVALWPHAVQAVTQGSVWELTWSGSPGYAVRKA
ncbi:RES family NAD+ phosphorylase [Novosphingobium sp. BL-52-GroH]|uniref:RES family NAD+ phosphorylase n=1 Tax=Novosphingobium sp. BL-52-GroH TaxID=3349877 RepID=UPI00384CB9B6